ncbi:MAG TPA: NAD-dependent epimerase/dehydratase family protein [Solirubrobacterales bacterium]|nr:NAD-dependent epimerase/dehydratase family protein [Solirubrobacterales bacterium]
MRILVTGATGKVGHAVVERLRERGDEVVALVRDQARARELLAADVELAPGDVTDPGSLRPAAAGCEAVVNCMGLFEQWVPDPGIFDRVNAEGARNVVVAAREAGARRVVHTSTIDVFEGAPGGTLSEAALAERPKATAYERSKQRAESLVLAEADGIEVVLVNPATVYGPGPWAEAGLDAAIRDAIRRRLPALPPGGMSLVYADDAARGHLAALDRGRPGERYILAGGYASAREIGAIAVDEAGRGWVPPTIPAPAARALATAGEALARVIRRPPLVARGQVHFLLWQARADSSRAREELGIDFIAPDEGVRRTVRWMIETGRV